MKAKKLLSIHNRYNRIFDKMMRCRLGSREHHRLLRIEYRLEHECIEELHNSGINTANPCPRQLLSPCDNCKGILDNGKTCHLKYPMDVGLVIGNYSDW